MKAGLKWGVLLAVALGSCLQAGRVYADVACAQFYLFGDPEYTCYYAAFCDGEPNSCNNYDYGLLDQSPAYNDALLPRECQAVGGHPQCEYFIGGYSSTKKPQTQNIVTTAPTSSGCQVVYYQCGKRCYCYTVCAATAPATAPVRTPAANQTFPRHVTRNVNLKQKRDETFMPTKNKQSPFTESINVGFPTYFSFTSLRKPGTTIFAKGFVVSTQKLTWKSKTYPGITAGTGFEVQQKSESYPLVAIDNVKLAPNSTSSYIIKVKGVEYMIHTTE